MMNPDTLYSHNREAYKAVMNHFNSGEQRACIVHATGTGKSYVIGAVAGHFEKVLVVAPNNYVIAQVQSTLDRNDVVYTTYQQLLTDRISHKIHSQHYDLIVFDEFHRTGARRWADGVNYVLQQNTGAKIFGTSATPIRYLDNGRNMAEELFNGHIMSTLNVTDAWVQGILVPPVYVISLDSFNLVKENILQKINSEYVPAEARPEMLQQLETAQQAWDKSGGVPGVIRDNIRPDVKRVIVFCPKIEKIEEDRTAIMQWFRDAGIRIKDTYIIDSSRSDKSNMDEMARFQQDGYQGVKVMVSVNMLNEGVHIPRVDAVIMLRRTISMNIYLQQIGRCMVANGNNRSRPVILDLQNNIVNVGQNDFFTKIGKEYKESIRKNNYSGEDRFMTIKGFEIDILTIIRNIEDRFNEFRWNADWYRCYAAAKEFYEKNGHFPTHKESRKIYQWVIQWWSRTYLINPQQYQDRAQMLMDIGYEHKSWTVDNAKKWEGYFAKAKQYYEQYGMFPETSLHTWAVRWWREQYLNNPQKYQDWAERLLSIGFQYKSKEDMDNEAWMKNYEECNAFYEEHGYFPTKMTGNRLYAWAMNWFRKNGLKNPQIHDEKIRLLRQIGFEYCSKDGVLDRTFKRLYSEAAAFYEKNGRFPKKTDNLSLRKGAVRWWTQYYLKNPERYREKAEMLTAIGFEYKGNKTLE